MNRSIKSRYSLHLKAFVTFNAVVVFTAFSGSDALSQIQAGQLIDLVNTKHLINLALPFATLILDGIVKSDFKSVLVYCRRRNPLPGHEAFSLHGKNDSRIDMNALEREYGPLPTDPIKQNQLWYRLSRTTADCPSVDEAHYAWLRTRDLTSLSFVLLPVSAVLALWLGAGEIKCLIVLGVQGLCYVFMRNIAADKGIRYVTTVLAETAASVDNLKSTI